MTGTGLKKQEQELRTVSYPSSVCHSRQKTESKDVPTLSDQSLRRGVTVSRKPTFRRPDDVVSWKVWAEVGSELWEGSRVEES